MNTQDMAMDIIFSDIESIISSVENAEELMQNTISEDIIFTSDFLVIRNIAENIANYIELTGRYNTEAFNALTVNLYQTAKYSIENLLEYIENSEVESQFNIIRNSVDNIRSLSVR